MTTAQKQPQLQVWKQKLLRNNKNFTCGNKTCSDTTTTAYVGGGEELLTNNDSCRCGNKSCLLTATIVRMTRPLLKNNQNCSLFLLCFQTQHIKPSAQVGSYDAEEFELLTPMIRISLSTIFSKFGSKELLKRVRNLSLSIRRGPWQFRSWLWGLEALKLASRRLKTFIWMCSGQQQLDKESRRCLLAAGRSREEEVFV
jgi:hypothetical protein